MQSADTLIQTYVDRQAALGMAVALIKEGELVYVGGFGRTHVAEHGVPVTPHTLFYYGSICKTICATLIMRLVEQGLLALDTPVIHYLPELRFSHADYGRRVTLRHLLSHTSGLPMGGKYWGPRDPDALRRFVYEQIPYYTFLSAPGAVHLYSNTVFCVAGHIAEAVTGKFYDDLVQEYVFDPLQMKGATYDLAVAITRSVAIRHEPNDAGQPQPMSRLPYNVSGNPSSFAYGSVRDLAHLGQMVLNQGRFDGQPFLAPASLAEMQRPHSSRHIASAALGWIHAYGGYGLGFEVGDYRGRRTARHGGAAICYFDLFPDDRAGVIVLTNFQNDRVIMGLIAELYEYVLDLPPRGIFFLDRPAPSATSLDSQQLQSYSGSYLRVETAEVVTFVHNDNILSLQQPHELHSLVPLNQYEFYVEFTETQRLPIAFIQGAAGQVMHVMVGGEPYHPLVLDPAFQPDPQQWQRFVGLYKDPSNSNRDEIFSVRLQDGQLLIAEGSTEAPCRAISERCFLSDLGLFEFVDTANSNVKILVWGKAVRFFPIDQVAYTSQGVIRYLVNLPDVAQRTG